MAPAAVVDHSKPQKFVQILIAKKAAEAAFMMSRKMPGDQLPAPPSTVTARRFCDQQEMSSHTATGRSLP